MSSRESDNAYPSPRHTGPDAYPSGTPPYGIPGLGSGFGTPAPGAEPYPRSEPPADQDVPKTETTLTTRISINIPGSRPIPPVVVRSTVKPEDVEEAAAEQPAAVEPPGPSGPRHRSVAPSSPVLGVMEAGGRTGTPPDLPPEWQTPPSAPETSESESTGEWFRPRQKNRPEPAVAAAPAPTATPAAGVSGLAAGSPYQVGERPQPSAAPAFSSETSQQIPVPRPTGAPASPFASAEEPSPTAPRYGGQPAGYPTDPYAAPPAEPYPGNPYSSPQPAPAPGPYGAAQGAPGRFARSHPPAEPFPPAPAQHQQPFAEGQFAPGRPGEPEDTQVGGFDPITGEQPPQEAILGLPVAGGYGSTPPRGTARTATPPPPPGAFTPEPGPTAPAPVPPAPAAPAAPAAPKPAAAGKPKGRSRSQKLLVYAVGGALFLACAAYGTGLMLNQADVPRGTTVLGTAIGGDSRDQAIHELDSTVGKIGQQPVKLTIGSQTLDLDPATAGLSFDTTATVDGLTKHSYNPMDVIGALTGGHSAVPPQVRVDRAKLKAALDQLTAKSAQGLKEGYVQFNDAGDPVVVPGQAGQAVDGAAAADQVEQAYRDRAAGKPDSPIVLASTAAQPKTSQQALQQAADGLGKAIASGKVTVWAGTKKFVFVKTMAGKTLTLAPDATGAIVAKWDLDQLSTTLGGVFDKVKYRKADGSQALITPQDVADGISSVFQKNTDAERTFRFHM